MDSSDNENKFQNELLNQIEKGSINFFVGAGISKEYPAKLQGGSELTELLLEKWISDTAAISKLKPYANMGTLRLEVLMQKGVETFSNKEVIARPLVSLLNSTPNKHHYFLAYALKRGCSILTTNFDILIESAYWNLYGSLPRIIISDDEFDCELFSSALIKLHGSVGRLEIENLKLGIRDSRETIIASLNQVAHGLSDKKTACFEKVVQQYPTLFWGYSCMDDFDIFPVINTKYATGRKPFYWIYFENKTELKLITQDDWKKFVSKIYSESSWEKPRRFKISNISATISPSDIIFIGNMSPRINRIVDNTWRLHPTDKYETQLKKILVDFLSSQKEKLIPEPPTWEKNILAAKLLVQVEERGDVVDRLYSGVYTSEAGDADFRLRLRIDHADAKTPIDPIQASNIVEARFINEDGIDNNTRAIAFMTLSNIKRRQKRKSESNEHIQKALQLLKNEMIKDETRFLVLHYYGLIKHQEIAEEVKHLKNEENDALDLMKKISNCEQLFVDSSNYFKKKGNVAEYTMCQNALGLLLIENGNLLKKLNKIIESNQEYERSAITLKDNVAKIRTKYGFFRGVGQAYRNIALARQGQENYSQALQALERSQFFYSLVKPNPPESDLFEVLFRQAETYIKVGKPESALYPIIRWIVQKQADSNWHDEARGLKLYIEAQVGLNNNLDARYAMKIILRIYQTMLSDERHKLILKNQRFGIENATETLIFIQKTAKRLMTLDYENDATTLLEQLEKC